MIPTYTMALVNKLAVMLAMAVLSSVAGSALALPEVSTYGPISG